MNIEVNYKVAMQKITPNLWFDNEAEEAAKFYVSIFDNSKILDISYYSADTPSNKPKGSVLTVSFELAGQKFLALNGGPFFKFNEAVSFIVDCGSQKEVDYYWSKLSAVPESEQCGWLKDKFGVSWQIIPKQLTELMNDPDPAKARRVTEAMLQMKKIDIQKLEEAHVGKLGQK